MQSDSSRTKATENSLPFIVPHTPHIQVSQQSESLENRKAQSAASYLQFGGGSRVISASSFWILKQDEDLGLESHPTRAYPACEINLEMCRKKKHLIDFPMSSWARE